MPNKFGEPMETRCFLLPPKWLQLLADLVREGYYESISAAIREGTREILKIHGKM